MVGVERAGGVVMGADTLGTDDDFRATVRTDVKVFRVDDLVIGFAGSFRVGQLLRYSFHPPERPDDPDDIMRYMCVEFVDAVRDCLNSGGATPTRDGVEEAPDTGVLVAVAGKVYMVQADYQVARSVCGYAAIGGGSSYAMGALYATSRSKNHRARVLTALEAASEHCSVVRGPFTILNTKT